MCVTAERQKARGLSLCVFLVVLGNKPCSHSIAGLEPGSLFNGNYIFLLKCSSDACQHAVITKIFRVTLPERLCIG